jgi:DNA polymerase III gamma/tau subunit
LAQVTSSPENDKNPGKMSNSAAYHNLTNLLKLTKAIVERYSQIPTNTIKKIIKNTHTLDEEEWNNAMNLAKTLLASQTVPYTDTLEDEIAELQVNEPNNPKIQELQEDIAYANQLRADAQIGVTERLSVEECKAATIKLVEQRWEIEALRKVWKEDLALEEPVLRPGSNWRNYLGWDEEEGVKS